MDRRAQLWFGGVALVLSALVVYGFVHAPTYTDAYYYLNAANRIATGYGLSDPVLWTYIGMPESLPAPSHSYWMPMASFLAAAGMWLLDSPLNYQAAQILLIPALWLIGYSAFWIVHRQGGKPLGAWVAGLMVILGGFFAPFWGMTETFTPFGAFGGGVLIAMGRGITAERPVRWFVLAGALAGAAHLTRADGLLFLLAGGAVVLWPWGGPRSLLQRAGMLAGMIMAYLLVMSPWLIRNLHTIGTPLPVGGAQAIWYTEYNDIFNFPPDASPARFFENVGWAGLWSSRWTGLTNGLQTLLFVEGFVFLFPLMVVALARRRQDPFWRPFWIYALGLHLAMTVVFPFPGYRGGLFHSAAALMPFWAALALLGLEDAIRWAARRRGWNPRTAYPVFSVAALLLIGALSAVLGLQGRPSDANPELYAEVAALLPPDARLMATDPSAVYYYTGRLGVTLPNETADILPQIAVRYQITHVLVENVTENGLSSTITAPLRRLPADPPGFLTPIPLSDPTARLYRFERAE
jgi:hypothetical protein